MGQHTLLHPHDEHHRILQPLGLVQRDEGGHILLLVHFVGVGEQADPFQEERQTLRRLEVLVIAGYAAKLQDVLPAIIAIRQFQRVFLVARRLEHRIQEFDYVHFLALLGQLFDHGEETDQRLG